MKDWRYEELSSDEVRLRLMLPEDWETLMAVASDPKIWELHPSKDRYKEEVFRPFFEEALLNGSSYVFIDQENNTLFGSSRFYGYNEAASSILIGYTFMSRAYWGGHWNKIIKHLMMAHAFKHVEIVRFQLGAHNYRSKRALEKIGAHIIHHTELKDEQLEMIITRAEFLGLDKLAL